MAQVEPAPPAAITTTSSSSITVHQLPAEILVEVFSYLPLMDVARAAAVCERWRGLLTHHTAVWRHKEYFSRKRSSQEEVEAIASTMPQLHCLHVLRDNEFGIHIAWPEAAVTLCCDLRHRPPTPYTVEFDVRRLVVSEVAFPACFRWVRCETLVAVRVADQCEGAGTHPASPFYYYGGGVHCFGPTCSYRGFRPTFCTLCTYSHHFNCAGKYCPLGGSSEEAIDVWCHPDRGRLGGSRRRRAAEEDDTSVEDNVRKPARCPALEELAVSGAGLAPADLRSLCTGGRLRALRVESACLRGLSFLRHCCATLEELTLTDAGWLPAESFKELRQLQRLKLLRLCRFRASRSAIGRYTRHLRGLQCILQKPLASAAAPLPLQDEEILMD